MRGHQPTTIDKFNGLWQQGSEENTPLDHFSDGENFDWIGDDIIPRGGLDLHQNVAVPLGNVVRAYNYITDDANTLLVLTYEAGVGKIYHVINATTIFGPILTITGMEDFGFVPFAGRAYITPFASFAVGALFIEKGLSGEFLYVYMGDGTAARKAGGPVPAGTLVVANGAAGNTDAGFHLFAVIGETDTGYLSAPVAIAGFTTGAALSVSFSAIPTFVGSYWAKRHIVATKVVTDYNGNTTGYTFYYLTDGTIPNNVATTLANISFFDQDLLEEASHLLDNRSEIPAGVGLALYHNRLILYTTFDDIALALVSFPGEPEAFSTIDGFLDVPPDGNPITNAQELRDVLYLFKRNRTVGYVDNEDEPATWQSTTLDQAFGSSVHGIATVIDSGGISVDFLIVASLAGIVIFNGRYVVPELSWKISKLWENQDRKYFRRIQLINDPIKKKLYCSLPDRRLLVGVYTKGLDPKNIKWTLWRFDIQVNTIALVNINDLIIGAETRLV